MAEIGDILEIETEEGQFVARVDCDYGAQVTATITQSGGCDFYPQKGDRVVFSRTGGSEIVILAVFSEDGAVGSGEWRTFSRDSTGSVKAVIHAKNDGSIAITNASGKTVDVGGALDFVAMATKVDNTFQAILTSIQGAAVGSADGGATFKSNLATAIQAALNTIGSVASQNLKAD
jgi:hypothetical protein